ncbi:oxidoreductase [Robbsia sp. Bb-Pol-6]|uniref:Oxidoreductase n=1 Tax=Robbsia betulipollinis TaxID=2981849 RepID=A0ABT3ZT55_9BURK|nr:MDR family oxidoreductase [Robbsia betulipollinis]MCY0389652.1 oxidoreductase [Robbsia betulipollinis]
MFHAILIEKNAASGPHAALQALDDERLPDGDVVVRIMYSTLNYKDALAITGRGAVVRQFPMVPGIDFAGVVERSADPRYQVDDTVLLTGWGVGETHWGGLAQRARVRGDWLLPLPAGLTARQSMTIGTAGFTAMLSVLALQRHGVTPAHGEILVTGASGGVGSVAIALLAQWGYRAVAATGRLHEHDYLRRLGAVEVVDRAMLAAPGKPLAKERWAGVIDSVGSHTLANACASTRQGGIVTACGLAQGMDFPGSVAPFILRGITLAGINSVYQPREARLAAWRGLAEALGDDAALATMRVDIGLSETIAAATRLLDGGLRGRCVVDVSRWEVHDAPRRSAG